MRKVIASLLAAQLVGGCSLAFVKGPPSNHRELTTFDCSTSNVAPVLDTLLTGLQVLNVVGAASSTDEEWAANYDGNPPISRDAAVPLYIGLALLSGASMIYGYSTTSACRKAKAEAVEYEAQRQRPNPDDEPAAPRRAPGAAPAPAPPPPPGAPAPAAAPAAAPSAASTDATGTGATDASAPEPASAPGS
jgi:hypothetical protein